MNERTGFTGQRAQRRQLLSFCAQLLWLCLAGSSFAQAAEGASPPLQQAVAEQRPANGLPVAETTAGLFTEE
ncbi:MAG: hypothetical protein ABW116_14055, partial [Candidatus Sedimenticola sp. 20ELBAFRAG]